MVVAYLLSGVSFGLFCAALWLLTGGTVLGALLVYVLSGNLCVASIVTGRVLLGPRKHAPQPQQG